MTMRATSALAGALLLLAATSATAQWRGPEERGGFRPREMYAAQPYGGGPGRYAPRGGGYADPYGGRGGGGWRRGQVLPPAYRDAYVPDPGRYHLRAAPPGYGWTGDGRNAYLTQRSTGMVLDSVPGAYEPAPAYPRGRGRGRPPR